MVKLDGCRVNEKSKENKMNRKNTIEMKRSKKFDEILGDWTVVAVFVDFKFQNHKWNKWIILLLNFIPFGSLFIVFVIVGRRKATLFLSFSRLFPLFNIQFHSSKWIHNSKMNSYKTPNDSWHKIEALRLGLILDAIRTFLRF